MEESKKDKVFSTIKSIIKILGYICTGILLIIFLFLVFYFVSGKSAEAKGHKQLVGLYTIISPSMTPNIAVYDVVLTYRVDNMDDLKVGDVITFYSSNSFFGGTPITHRIVDIRDVPGQGISYVTKGDANQVADSDYVFFDNIVGKVECKIPQLGRLQFFIASKGGILIAILIPSLCVIAYDLYKIIKLVVLKNKMLSLRNSNGNI